VFRVGQRVKIEKERMKNNYLDYPNTWKGNEHDHVGVIKSRCFQEEITQEDGSIIPERWVIWVNFMNYTTCGAEWVFVLA